MATCPNKNLDSWKNLVQTRGENIAYFLWDKYAGNVPANEFKSDNQVNFDLKSVNILTSDKAVQLFKSLEKNKVTGDTFWKKVQELGIPKEQIDILKSFDTYDREELITEMLANFSYTVEINTGIKQQSDFSRIAARGDNPFEFQDEEVGEIGKPTQYYSNLTVPGGTNYTENEIATPAISPSIRGHAQFATDKGIGWFRSDDAAKGQVIRSEDIDSQDSFTYEGSVYIADLTNDKFYKDGKEIDFVTFSSIRNKAYTKIAEGVPTKTRRILELQSDLYQKSRDIKSPDEIIAQLQKEGKLKIDCN